MHAITLEKPKSKQGDYIASLSNERLDEVEQLAMQNIHAWTTCKRLVQIEKEWRKKHL